MGFPPISSPEIFTISRYILIRIPIPNEIKPIDAKQVHWFLDIFSEKYHGYQVGHYFKRSVDAIF